MDQTIVIKYKILDNTEYFTETANCFRDACNYISEWVFNNGFELSSNKVQSILYHEIRDKFKLKSQMTVSAIRFVVSKYKAIQTQLKQKPFKYYDRTTKKTYKISRDLDWLIYPVHFKNPIAVFQRNRDWSFVNNQLSINTIKERVQCNYICEGFDQYKNYVFGMSILLQRNGQWFLHICATFKLPDYNLQQTKHIVGIDRGIRFLATCYDEQGKTLFYSGKEIIRKRNKYKKVRAELQKKGTKSAKRRLKKIGHRENRWMSDVNHCISKALVNHYGKNTLFVLENLTGVTYSTVHHRKKENRYEHDSWAYYQFEQDLIYKAKLNGCQVMKVNPRYTSQRCPKCGRINYANRNHDLHLYTCDNCGYKSNDDRIGAMNIQNLGIQYLHGNNNPYYKK